jgi:hypothetical protein
MPYLNFTNILQAAFSYESFFAQLLCGPKAAHKMLVKWTPGQLS